VVVAGSVIFALGLAPVYVLATEMCVGAAPPERSGAASGILETGAELGGALGIAFLGSVGGAVYRDAMDASALPGVPGHLWEEARRTLAGALDAETQLPASLAGDLAAAAQDAFVSAFHVVEALGAGLLAALAVTSLVLLRRTTLGAPLDEARRAPIGQGPRRRAPLSRPPTARGPNPAPRRRCSAPSPRRPPRGRPWRAGRAAARA
jgi:DHA2 family multidrug resistance protein-like MFS transporter